VTLTLDDSLTNKTESLKLQFTKALTPSSIRIEREGLLMNEQESKLAEPPDETRPIEDDAELLLNVQLEKKAVDVTTKSRRIGNQEKVFSWLTRSYGERERESLGKYLQPPIH